MLLHSYEILNFRLKFVVIIYFLVNNRNFRLNINIKFMVFQTPNKYRNNLSRGLANHSTTH